MASTKPAGNGLLIIERILRDRAGVWEQIVAERALRPLITQMLVSSAISLALYGTVLGASYGWQQALSSLVKLPLLFLATLAICLPTLYLFNLVFGARLSMIQAVALILVSITVTAVLTLAFAPISLFFLITAQSYAFFKLLNVAILVLTALVGLRFLVEGMRALNERQDTAAALTATIPAPGTAPGTASGTAPGQTPAPATIAASANGAETADSVTQPLSTKTATTTLTVPALAASPLPALGHAPAEQRSASMGLLYIWIVLFGFVGTQLAWTLRPFFGDPGKPFGLFREIGGTFYADVFRTIGHLLGG
jgi:hypothetical protein